MTIRDKNGPPTPPAPAEDDVVVIAEPAADPYTSRSNVNVPYAEATSVEAQAQALGSEPDQQRIAYATVSPPQPSIATATGSPVIRVEHVPTTTTTGRRNNRGCCSERNCCCWSIVIFFVVFVCCLLPFVVFLVINAIVLTSNVEDNYDDTIFGITDDLFNNDYTVSGEKGWNENINGINDISNNYGN